MTVVEALIEALGTEKVLTKEAVADRYYHIWKMNMPLQAKAVVLPKTTEDVAAAMKICYDFHQKVVVHGGLTNLVNATFTTADEVVIAMEKMTAIEEVDEKSRTITAQAGVILERIQQAAKEKDLLFPLNFGAKGSAQVGGFISTNAGGLQVFRYGMTRNLVLGLEAVLADGTIISSLKKIIKDNSAYDLKQLFIGSEGTLGIITKAVLKLVEAPKSRVSAFVGLNSFDNVVRFLKYMDSGLAGTLSAYELIWKDTFIAMTSPPTTMKAPLPYDYEYYVLLDSLGSNQTKDQETLQDLLEQALTEGIIEDGTIADNAADLRWFWRIREDVHAFVSQCNHDQHFDISIPIGEIGDVMAEIQEKLWALPEIEQVFVFGHMADGNIHVVVGKSNGSVVLKNKVNDIVYAPLQALKGSISAEHGIGLDKKTYLPLSRSTAEIALMKTLKRAMDDRGILNIGKVIDL